MTNLKKRQVSEHTTCLEDENSHRQRTELAVRESEARFHHAFADAPVGRALLVAPDGEFQEVNWAMSSIVGYSEPELLARDYRSITHPQDLPTVQEQLKQALSGQHTSYSWRITIRSRHWDRCLGPRVGLAFTRQPEPPAVLHFPVQDVTEDKLANEALRESDDRLNLGSSSFFVGSPGFDGRDTCA